jgi:xenotropic and polytropic retrovirus receptor 1
VNRFYASQEEELLTRGKALMEQLDILVDVKKIIADHSSRSSRRSNESSDRHLLSSGMASPQSMSGSCNSVHQKRSISST